MTLNCNSFFSMKNDYMRKLFLRNHSLICKKKLTYTIKPLKITSWINSKTHGLSLQLRLYITIHYSLLIAHKQWTILSRNTSQCSFELKHTVNLTFHPNRPSRRKSSERKRKRRNIPWESFQRRNDGLANKVITSV